MNATPVVLAGESVASMIRAAERACGAPDLRLAIVDGFAVTCRLGRVHRSTGDVDMVADELATVGARGLSSRALVELGIARPDPGGKDNRVFVDGTKLEIIETQDLHEGVDEIGSTLDRLFLLGRRWALVGAEPTRVTVAGTSPRGLAESVHELAADKLVENAERVVRYLKVYGEPVWSEISGDDIRRVFGSLVVRLRN